METNQQQSGTRQSLMRWFSHTSMYGFELFMASFGLTVAAVVIDYGLFAFFNYIKGFGADDTQQIVGQVSLWIVAAMLVWLPLAVGFYLRARGEQASNPERKTRRLHKIVVSVFLFANILILAGAFFTVLYTIIQLLVGSFDMAVADVLLRLTLPALLVAILHGWLLFAFSNVEFARRKVFAIVFVVIGLVVMTGLSIASFGSVRGAAEDNRRERDLTTISNELRDYYSDRQSLPDDLDDLKLSDSKLMLSTDNYTYDRQLGARYELCTDFVTDTQTDSSYSDDNYVPYGNFSSHDKGRQCFKLTAGYDYPENQPVRYDYKS